MSMKLSRDESKTLMTILVDFEGHKMKWHCLAEDLRMHLFSDHPLWYKYHNVTNQLPGLNAPVAKPCQMLPPRVVQKCFCDAIRVITVSDVIIVTSWTSNVVSWMCNDILSTNRNDIVVSSLTVSLIFCKEFNSAGQKIPQIYYNQLMVYYTNSPKKNSRTFPQGVLHLL